MDANAVVHELKHKKILSSEIHERISACFCRERRNEIMYDHLMQTSTNESFIIACDIIMKVEGNPAMAAFGELMKEKLQTGVWMLVFMHAYICVTVNN